MDNSTSEIDHIRSCLRTRGVKDGHQEGSNRTSSSGKHRRQQGEGLFAVPPLTLTRYPLSARSLWGIHLRRDTLQADRRGVYLRALAFTPAF